jgi:hypothetical protein
MKNKIVEFTGPEEGTQNSHDGQARLLKAFLEITAGWRGVFCQTRTFHRALRQALGGLLCLGRRTITRIIWTNGREQEPWGAEYKLHSRSQWDSKGLFESIWKGALEWCPGSVVGVALDDTRLPKTGKCILQAFLQRDPLSPPFHVNLMLALRFLQASLLVPTHRFNARFGARALPVDFQEASRVKKPGKKASPEAVEAWKAEKKKRNLSLYAVAMMRHLRAALDQAGGALKTLIMVTDGSFCNRTCFGAKIQRTEILARARKDAKLCFRASEAEGKRRFYSQEKFTPESVRKDEKIPWMRTRLAYGGKRRKLRFKQLRKVFWQGGARRRLLRLIVIAPTPYRKRKSAKLYYRQPAYLLTTDLKTPVSKLIQLYLDRWQIEVNHREEKDTLGVGQAQVWNPNSVPRQPVLAVAAYSALLLAALKALGPARNDAYAPLPAWRKHAWRPSALDLIALLRKEAAKNPHLIEHLEINNSPTVSVAAAAA